MQAPTEITSPFAALLTPRDVLDAIKVRGNLSTLKSRVHRPLDKPLIPLRTDAGLKGRSRSAELMAYDAAIDSEQPDPVATDWNGKNSGFGEADFVDTRRLRAGSAAPV